MSDITLKFMENVARLVKPGEDVISDLTPESAHRLHMGVLIVTEALELAQAIEQDDAREILWELGDVEFAFEAIQASCFNINIDSLHSMQSFDVMPLKELTKELGYACEAIASTLKKHAIHAKPLNNVALHKSMMYVRTIMRGIYNRTQFTQDQAKRENIEKLKIRQPGGKFNNNDAEARVDESKKYN